MMKAYVLVEPHMQPIPPSIQQVSSFGTEKVVIGGLDDKAASIRVGDVYVLEGSRESFRQWLGQFENVCVSYALTSGCWNVCTVAKQAA